jgi:hypothetical protein
VQDDVKEGQGNSRKEKKNRDVDGVLVGRGMLLVNYDMRLRSSLIEAVELEMV